MTREEIIQEFKEIIWRWIARQVEKDKSKELERELSKSIGKREYYYPKGV